MGLCTMSVLILTLSCASQYAAAARDGQQQQLFDSAAAGVAPGVQTTLNTYYVDTVKPTVELSSRASSRPGRTAVNVKLAESSVSRYMAW